MITTVRVVLRAGAVAMYDLYIMKHSNGAGFQTLTTMNAQTTDQLIAALAKRNLNAVLWEKEEMRRLYINGVGYNTKKTSQKLWLDLATMEVKAKTICDSQLKSWCDSESAKLVDHYEAKILMAVLPASAFEVMIVDLDNEAVIAANVDAVRAHIAANYELNDDNYTDFEDSEARITYQGRLVYKTDKVDHVVDFIA